MPFVQLAIFTLIIHSKLGLQLSGPLSTVNSLPSAGVTLRNRGVNCFKVICQDIKITAYLIAHSTYLFVHSV